MAKSKGSKVGLIALLVMLVMLILTIVGVCIDWVSGALTEAGYTLGEISETIILEEEISATFKAMESFAIITVILVAASTVIAGICNVLDWKLFKLVLVIVSIASVVTAVITIILSYSFCDKIKIYTVAAGAWLTAIGGILAGVTGVLAAVKK